MAIQEAASPKGPINHRVLYVIHFPVFGGPHNQALRLNAPLAARGFDTIVVVPEEPGNAAERLHRGGVDVRRIRLQRLRATRDIRLHFDLARHMRADIARLRSLIRSERISLVQIGGLVNPHAAIAARLESVPVVWQLLDTRAPRPVAAVAMIAVQKLADIVMSTGHGVAKAHPGYTEVADRVIRFFPPVDVDRFAPQPERRRQVRSEWGVSAADLVVGCVANINPQKGIVELVDAFAKARADFADAKLVLIGAEYVNHTTYAATVRNHMKKSGLVEGTDVIFVGERDDVEHQLAGMDVFALAATPRSEGITTAVLEAMAAGLPTVVTDVGALREAVDDQETGYIVPPSDSDKFRRALALLFSDPGRRTEMGKRARRVAAQRFDIETCADVHVRAYTRALAAGGTIGNMPTKRRSAQPSAAPATVIDEVPIFIADRSAAMHDELDHHQAHAHKATQAAHFDRADQEAFEAERPHGTPRFYKFLLVEKFSRAVSPIRRYIKGSSALTVCGGSGMDAEFLAREGANVISSDLSLGAAARAKWRAQKYRLSIQSIVADVEDLPFSEQSVDLVSVHDGLHHLVDPFAGLSEMARVARRWVLVTEPAQASMTRLAIRLGLALETEEAGNRVARLELSEVSGYLEGLGFEVLRAERYAMYYPHRPGAVFRLLSRPFVYPLARTGWRIANALIGRFGNKMVVVAERIQPSLTESGSPPAPSPTRSSRSPASFGPPEAAATIDDEKAGMVEGLPEPDCDRPATLSRTSDLAPG